MSQKKVRAIYEGRLATWAAARSPALTVAWENKPFTPVTGAVYLQASLLPAETGSETLLGEHRAYRGVFQVNIVAPINTGPGAANGIADELAALFVNYARITAAGFTVQQLSPARIAPALASENRYVVPVSFEYRADTV